MGYVREIIVSIRNSAMWIHIIISGLTSLPKKIRNTINAMVVFVIVI
jgi:hypothetical protein